MTNKRLPVLKDCFKVRKGLCVTGDAVISGNLTVSGGLNVIGPVSGEFKDPRFDELFTLVSESSACWNLACAGGIVCDYAATAISYPVDEIDTVLTYAGSTPLSSVLYTPVGEPIVNSQQLLLFVQEVSGVVIDTSSYAREPSVGEYGLTDDVLFDSVSGFTTTGRTQYKHDDLILGTDNFTIEAWVIPGPVDPDHRIRLFEQAVKHTTAGGGSGVSNDSNLTLMHEEGTAGKLRLRAYGGADVVSSNSMIVDQWNHVVVQRTGDVLELYINGAESGSLSLPDQYEFLADTMHVGNIGAEYTSNSQPDPESTWKWKGAISDFTITRNALYLTDFDVPTTSLAPVSSGEQPASWMFEGDVEQQVTFPAAAGTFAAGEDFTIEFWTYRLSDQSPHEDILCNESDIAVDGQNGWRVLYNWQSGEGYKFIHTQSAQVLNTGNVTNEEWHHVAFVRHDNNLFAYVDGNLMACEPDVDRELVPYNIAGQCHIGGHSSSYSTPNSLFSDIQITKKALYTQQEGFAPPARFDACDEIPVVSQGTHIDTQGESIFPETDDFTAEIWVYMNELPTDPNTSNIRLFTQQNLADNRKWTYLNNRMAYASPEYRWFQFVCNDGSGTVNNHTVVQNFESTTPMQAKTWHHVLIERKNVTEWSLYLDGVKAVTKSANWLGDSSGSPSGAIAQHTGPVQLPTWTSNPGVDDAYILHRDFRVTTGGVCKDYSTPVMPLEPQLPHNILPAKLLPQCAGGDDVIVLDTDDLTHDPESARVETIYTEHAGELKHGEPCYAGDTNHKPEPVFELVSDASYSTASVTDSSTNNYSVNEISGTVTHDSTNALFGRTSLLFDSGDHLRVDGATQANLGTGDFTIEFWTKTDAAPTDCWRSVISLGDGHLSSNGLTIYVPSQISTPTGAVAVISNTQNPTIYSTTVVNDNQWHHVALIRSNGTSTLYIDGVAESSFADNTAYDAGGVIHVGETPDCRDATNPGSHDTYVGNLQNLRIYKQALYTSDFTPTNDHVKECDVLMDVSSDLDQSEIEQTVTLRYWFKIPNHPDSSIRNGTYRTTNHTITQNNTFTTTLISSNAQHVGIADSSTWQVSDAKLIYPDGHEQPVTLRDRTVTIDYNYDGQNNTGHDLDYTYDVPYRVTDASDNQFAPTLSGGVRHDTSNPFRGKSSLYFPGDGLMTFPASPVFNFDQGGDFTIECWVNLESYNEHSAVPVFASSPTGNWSYNSVYDGTNNYGPRLKRLFVRIGENYIGAAFSNMSGNSQFGRDMNIGATVNTQLGKWHHVALVGHKSPQLFELYFDGVKVTEGKTTEERPIDIDHHNFTLGGYKYWTGTPGDTNPDVPYTYLNGHIQNFKVTQTAKIPTVDKQTVTFNQDVCDPEPLLYINYNYTSPGGSGNTTHSFRLDENGYPFERGNGDQFNSWDFMEEDTGIFQITLQTTQFTGGTTNSHRISRDPNGPWTDVSVETTAGVYQQKIGNYWYVTYRLDIGQQQTISPSGCKFPVGERVLLTEPQQVDFIQEDTPNSVDLQNYTVGNYEFATVKSHVDSRTVELTQHLTNQYTVENYLYMAYTPRVKHLTVTEGTAITPSAWSRDEDKLTGLLWLNADTIVVEGTASATARGFRGGALTSTSADAHGARGEGVVIYDQTGQEVWGGRKKYGYAGAGGGGPYIVSNGDWGGTGSGGGNATSGGQSASYGSYSSTLQVNNHITYKMFMGGGGGQGGCDGGSPYDSNPGRGGYGGRGGGICIIDADYAEIVPESGFVGSRGENGKSAYDPGDSEPGPGGSGAGGTVLFTGDTINSDTIETSGGTANQRGGNGRTILLRSDIVGSCPVGSVLTRASDINLREKQNKTFTCDDLLLHVQPEGGDHESFNIRGRSDEMTGGKTNYIYLHDMSIDYTVSFWVYLEDTSSNNNILKTINNSSGNVGVQLQLQSQSASTASVNYWVFAGSQNNAVLELHAEGCLTARQWHHVSIAIDASALTGEIHVDGVNVALGARADYGTIGPTNMHPTQTLTLVGSNHGDILMNDLRIDKTYSPFTTVPTELLPAATADTNVLFSTAATMNAPTTYFDIPRVANDPWGRAYVIEDRSYNCIVWSDGNVVTQSSDGPYGEGSLYIPAGERLKTDLPKSETNFLHNSSLGQEYTIEAWIKCDDWSSFITGQNQIVGTGRTTAQVGFNTYVLASGSFGIRYTWGQAGNATSIYSDDGLIKNDTWQHIAIQHDSNRVVQLFVDGVMVKTQNPLTFNPIPNDSYYQLYVGDTPDFPSSNKYIQGVRITKGLVYSGRGVTTLHVPYAQEIIKNYPVNSDNNYWGDWLNFTTRQRIPMDQVMDVSVLSNQQYQSLSNQTDLLIQTAAGETISDKSYNQHAITIVGDATIDSTETLFGNDTINFDGSGDYLSIADKSAFKYIHNLTSEYTIEGWVYVDTITRDSLNRRSIGIVGNGGSSQFKGFQLYFGTTGLEFGTIDGNGSSGQGVTSVSHPMTDAEILNNWMHVAVVYDMSETRLYLNGTLVASSDNVAVTPVGADATHDLTIGYTPHGSGVSHYPMDGYIQYLRISKQAVYTNDFTPPGDMIDADIHIPSLASIPTPGTAGNSICDDTVLQLQLTGGEVKDTTLYRHDITETGTVTEVDGMMQFDGSSHLVLPGGDHLDLKDNDFTIEFRMNTNSHRTTNGVDTGTGLIDTYSGGAKTGWGYFIYTNEDGMSFLYTTSSAPHWKYLTIFSSIACYGTNEIGREYHIAITRVGDKLSSYVDGKLVERVTETEAIQYTGQDLMIGKRYSGPGYHYIGSLNEIRIVNGQSLYTDEEDIMTPDRRFTTDDQATLHIQPHLDLECVETGTGGGASDDSGTITPTPSGEPTGASSAGVFVTDISSGGITQKTYDETQVAIGSYAPIVSAVVDDANISFTVEWEGASDEWTGYPTVSGHVITKDDTSAISGDQTIRRYRATKTLNFDSYAGQTITIPVEFKGSTDSVDLQIAGGGPEILDIQASTTYPHQQDHYMTGDDIELTVTFNTSDVISIRFIDDTDTVHENISSQSINVDSSTKQGTITIKSKPGGSWNDTIASLWKIKAAATNSLGTEGEIYTSPDLVSAKRGPVITDITFDADPYPGDQIELKSGDTFNVHFTFDSANVDRVQFASSTDVTTTHSKTVNMSGKTGTTSVTVQTNLKSDQSLSYYKSVRAAAKTTSGGSYGPNYTSTNKVYVNDQYATFTDNGVNYPAGQNGIKAGEEATVNLQATNVGANPTYMYSQPTGQLAVPPMLNGGTDHANDVYVYPKRTLYNSGNYNTTTPNFRLTVTRRENGATSSEDVVVNIANVAPTLSVSSNNGNRMRSGGNDGTTAQNYTILVNSNQELESFSMNAPHGQLSAWSSGNKKTWTSTMQVHDVDQKGTHQYNTVNAVGITGMVANTLNSGESYTLGGFVSRSVILPPAQSETQINVLWSTYNKMKITWDTGLQLTNQAPPGTSDAKGSAANPDWDWCIADQTVGDTGIVPITVRLLDYSATGSFTSPTTLTIEEEV